MRFITEFHLSGTCMPFYRILLKPLLKLTSPSPITNTAQLFKIPVALIVQIRKIEKQITRFPGAIKVFVV